VNGYSRNLIAAALCVIRYSRKLIAAVWLEATGLSVYIGEAVQRLYAHSFEFTAVANVREGAAPCSRII
jgi:hypothetical protein